MGYKKKWELRKRSINLGVKKLRWEKIVKKTYELLKKRITLFQIDHRRGIPKDIYWMWKSSLPDIFKVKKKQFSQFILKEIFIYVFFQTS